MPILTNLRLDPFERMGFPSKRETGEATCISNWFMYEFWRFVFVQQVVGKLAMTAIDYPPMQKGPILQPRRREGEDRRSHDKTRTVGWESTLNNG